MNTTHTPGPWTAEPLEERRHDYDWRTFTVRSPGNNCIAVVGDVDRALSLHTDGNARLIAAAPLLLEALTRVVAGAGYTSGYADPGTLRKNGMGLNVPILFLDEARAAIAKATGGT